MAQICLLCGREVRVVSKRNKGGKLHLQTLEQVLQKIRELRDIVLVYAEQHSGVKKQGLMHEVSAYGNVIRAIERMIKEVENENH